MTVNGWMQILFFHGDYFRHNEAARQLHVSCLRGRPAAVAAPVRTPREVDLQAMRRGSEGAARLETVRAGDADLQRHHVVRHLRHRTIATYVAAESRRTLALSPADLAFNTASSFTTNTNWQAYGGESTMSYLTQMAGLAWHNFISVAVGIGVMMALTRGITYRSQTGRSEDARQFLGRSGSVSSPS